MQTPIEMVKRGRKAASECPSDMCRLCKCSFKVRFSDFKNIYYRKLYLRHRRLQMNAHELIKTALANPTNVCSASVVQNRKNADCLT